MSKLINALEENLISLYNLEFDYQQEKIQEGKVSYYNKELSLCFIGYISQEDSQYYFEGIKIKINIDDNCFIQIIKKKAITPEELFGFSSIPDKIDIFDSHVNLLLNCLLTA